MNNPFLTDGLGQEKSFLPEMSSLPILDMKLSVEKGLMKTLKGASV